LKWEKRVLSTIADRIDILRKIWKGFRAKERCLVKSEKRGLTIEHMVGDEVVSMRIERPIRVLQAPDEHGNGALRVELSPTHEQLAHRKEGFPNFRPHTIDQIESHVDQGEVPAGAASLRGMHQAVTDGFGSMVFYCGEMSDGKPGDKFLAFHVHSTNVHGIVITNDHQVVLQRESRQGRVDKTPILQGVCGGCKSFSDVAKVFRSELLAESGCRPGPDAKIYDLACGPPGRAKFGNFWTEDGVFGWPEHYVIATGYDAKLDHTRLSENISGVELVPLAEFRERARRLEYEDLTLLVLAQTIELDGEGRFQGIVAPHQKIWDARER
jgi:hypothetical protein